MWLASLDFETTGLVNPDPVSVAVVRIERGHDPVTVLYTLVKPSKPIEAVAMSIHGITEAMVADARPWLEVVADVVTAMEGCAAIVCHNSPYDVPILLGACREVGFALPTDRILCTLVLSRHLWGLSGGNKLDDVSARLGISLTNAHNAEADATATGRILGPLIRRVAGDDDPPTLDGLTAWTAEHGAEQEAALCARHRRPNPKFWEGLPAALATLALKETA